MSVNLWQLALIGLTVTGALSFNIGFAQTSNESVSIGPESDRREVTLKLGALLLVSLPVAPGTGFRWRVSAPASNLLREVEPSIFVGQKGPGFGRSEDQIIKFRADRLGTATLELRYARPWESIKSAIRSYRVTVTIY